MLNRAALLPAAALATLLTLGLAARVAAAESADGPAKTSLRACGSTHRQAAQSAESTSAESTSAGSTPAGSISEAGELVGDAAVRDTGALVDAAIEKLGAEDLSGEEITALKKLAAEHPELAEQSGGYLSNDDLLTILLVVILVMLIL